MKEALTLSLGGISILIQSGNSKIINLSKEAFKGFIHSNTKHTIEINIVFDEEFRDANPYAYGNPHRTNVIREATNIFSRGSIYRGRFDLRTLKGEIRQGLSIQPLYLFLRFILSIYLPRVDGFLLHSTSVIKDAGCFLFSGKPQSGKSTIAKLSTHYKVLSDDFSIVRKMGDRFYCFGSPFWGHVEVKGENIKPKKDCIPIKALYFLKQDDEAYVRKLDKKEGTLRLIQNISVLAKDSDIYKKIMKLADDFTDKVAVSSLHFRLDDSFWRWIR